jgi:hypothetical protein
MSSRFHPFWLSIGGRPTSLALTWAACLLIAVDQIALAQTGTILRPAADRAGLDCGRLREGRPLVYRNPRFGLTMTYPSSFALDPDSIPDSGDTARFWTPDRQATAVVTALRNGLDQSLTDLLHEAKRDVTDNSGGMITYTRIKDNWFVISGFMAGRIFYRRTWLAQGAGVIGNLWIEFPRTMRPCFEDAVTMMSLSFRQVGP